MAKYRMYDYLCAECGHVWEETIDIDNPEQVKCPHCESAKTERLPNAAGGYKGNFGGGSTSPRSRGSFKRSKA